MFVSSKTDRQWWKDAVVMQIWPHSFLDSNGDGIGDLPGITSKIDYIKNLGIDVLWLSPVYASPLKDYGYDISDFKSINPLYGTLEDWDRLLDACSQRGMKIMMDLVLNHTSDQHTWFLSAKSSRASPYRDFYFWRDARPEEENGPEPNNWKSVFSGSAWTWSEETGQYYLHQYAVEQPDCQWENPAVREAFYDIVRFWLERGCSGFRLDACSRLSKVEGLPDAEIVDATQRYQNCNKLVKHGPNLCEYFRELQAEALQGYDLITVGEMSDTTPTMAMRYTDPNDKQLQMIFPMDYWALDHADGDSLRYRRCPLPELKDCLNTWQTDLDRQGGWNSVVTSNHDQGRVVSKWGNDTPQWRTTSAKLLAILQSTQPGTLYVYQGEELGMKNMPDDYKIEDMQDVQTINYWHEIRNARQASSGEEDPDMSDVLADLRIKARDNGRLPVPWDAEALHAGFTTSSDGPWMVANKDDLAFAAAQQVKDPNSVLAFWKECIALRKKHNGAFVYGTFGLLDRDHPEIFSYTLAITNDDGVTIPTMLVVLNFCSGGVDWQIPSGLRGIRDIVINNYDKAPKLAVGTLRMDGWQGVVYTLTE